MIAALLVGLLVTAAGPVYAKDARTYYDDATVAHVRGKVEAHDWAQGQAKSIIDGCAWYLERSDQELWDFVPPPEQLRAINVCIAHDCPTCGDEITRKAGHYPWITSRDKPFKLECPVCKGVFPKNDFQPWNSEGLEGKPATGPEPVDNGLGWADPRDGRRYYFVPYYIFWQRWNRDILSGIRRLSEAYVLTGDPAYAHKCAVMVAKIASEYERFDYPTQCYHEGRFGVGGRISDYIWSTGNDIYLARAADAVWPALGEDAELVAFLSERGLTDPRGTFEEMLLVMAEDIMSGRIAGNMGMHQKTLCELAIVLDNDDETKGATTAEMRDWLMAGPGRVEDLLWNGFWREGLGGESSPSYASGWCVNFYEVANLLPRLGVEIWDNPKLKKMADVGLDLTIAGKHCPCIGDAGSMTGGGLVGWSSAIQGPAFMQYGDPRHAWALHRIGAQSRDLFNDYFDEAKVARAVEEQGAEIEFPTRNLGGFGVGILEAGQGEDRRGLSMYYGSAEGGHGHYDRLNLEFIAFGRPMMPEDGYPTPFTRPDFHEWRRSDTHRHYCVMIDETPQLSLQRGFLNSLVDTPGVRVMDAHAEDAYPSLASMYRRTAALIDISPEASYLLDIFRVAGGAQQDWCFHGPPFPEFSVSGGEFGPVQEKGTLAGEHVPYGANPGERTEDGQLVVDLTRAEGVLTGDHYGKLAPKGWTPHGKGILTQKLGETVRTKVAQIPAGALRVFLRIWDYNAGENVVDVTVGGVTRTFRYGPSGTSGYRWISEVLDLPEATDAFAITSREMGQQWITIDRAVISLDPDRAVAELPTGVSSGFQGLWDVRRMRPEGMWQATWRKPDEDLGLTMTMPAGCVQQVITALGEPELTPDAPDSVPYVIGRNLAAGAEGLSGRYVAVVEPHRGPAQVGAVTQLAAPDAPRDSVGLRIDRGAQTDWVHSGLTPDRCEWTGADQPFSAEAEFALVTTDAQGVVRACLVNGTSLQWGDFALRASPPPSGKVLSVDPIRNEITMDAALPTPEALPGRVIILSNELQSTSYTIASASVQGETTVLSFGDVLFIVGMRHVAGMKPETGEITADAELAGYGRTDGGRHQGRWVYNEDKTRCFRIEAAGGSTLKLRDAPADLQGVFTDADGDGRARFWISDIGPGDSYRLPTATWFERG